MTPPTIRRRNESAMQMVDGVCRSLARSHVSDYTPGSLQIKLCFRSDISISLEPLGVIALFPVHSLAIASGLILGSMDVAFDRFAAARGAENDHGDEERGGG
jgi:hypothetical protein